MARFIVIPPENPSDRDLARLERFRALDSEFCRVGNVGEPLEAKPDAIVRLHRSNAGEIPSRYGDWYFEDGYPRSYLGSGAIHEAVRSGARRIGIALCNAATDGRPTVWAFGDVQRRSWDSISNLEDRVDNLIPVLLRDAAERIDRDGKALPYELRPAPERKSQQGWKQRLGDSKFFIHLLLSRLVPVLRVRQPRILVLHNPAADILDQLLQAFGHLGPFRRYSEIVTAFKNGQQPEPGFAITFDDGYKEHLCLLDVLEKHRCSAMFFVTTAPVDSNKPLWFQDPDKYNIELKLKLKQLDYAQFLEAIEKQDLTAPSPLRGRFSLTSEEIRLIARRGHEIGVHTENHPFLSRLSPAEIRTEVLQAHHRLKEILDNPVLPLHLAYPDGNYSPDVLSVLADIGVDSAATTNRFSFGDASSLLELPRFGVGDMDYPGFALFKMTSLYNVLKRAGPPS